MAKQIVNDNINAPVTDIDLSVLRKKRFRIDGDDNRILELNTSDLNLLSRLKEAYPKLIELTDNAVKDWPELNEDSSLEDPETTALVDALHNIDVEMRKLVDYIFDSNVAEVCVPSGSMYDPINGQFRFEHIIDSLAKLYESNITEEVKHISSRVKKHTDKYTKK